MGTFAEDVRAARVAKGWSQEKLAELAGTTQSTIERVENGGSQRSRFIVDIARALGLPLPGSASLGGVVRPPPAFMNERDKMPVYAATEGGDGHLIVSTDEIDRVPRPYTLEGISDAYAILVTGESMVPAYRPGDYAWVNPRLPPMKGEDCIIYSVNEHDEAVATIKEMVSWTARAWTLKQHNPAKTFPLDRTIWNKHHRVVGNFRRR